MKVKTATGSRPRFRRITAYLCGWGGPQIRIRVTPEIYDEISRQRKVSGDYPMSWEITTDPRGPIRVGFGISMGGGPMALEVESETDEIPAFLTKIEKNRLGRV